MTFCRERRGLAKRCMAGQGAERHCEARLLMQTDHHTANTRLLPAVCIYCGRVAVMVRPGGVAECHACHKRMLVTDLQRQIADKQRKAVGR